MTETEASTSPASPTSLITPPIEPIPNTIAVTLSLAELIEAYLDRHVEVHYRHPDGRAMGTSPPSRAISVFGTPPVSNHPCV